MTKLHNTEHFDLHNEDGTHRSTCSTADGRRVEQHEATLRGHLDEHDEHDEHRQAIDESMPRSGRL